MYGIYLLSKACFATGLDNLYMRSPLNRRFTLCFVYMCMFSISYLWSVFRGMLNERGSGERVCVRGNLFRVIMEPQEINPAQETLG